MSLPRCEIETNNIQKLPDKPTLSSSEIKQAFDKSGKDLKEFLNVLITEIEKLVTEEKVIVENVLTSQSTTHALSSLQGKNLKEMIDGLESNKQKKITYGTKEPSNAQGNNGDLYIQYLE